MKQLVYSFLLLLWSSTSWAVYLKMPDVEPMVNPKSSASHAGTRLLKFYKVPMDEKKFRRNCPAFVKGENTYYGNSPDLLKKCLNLNSGRGMSFETAVVGSVESLQSMLDQNTPIIILAHGLGLTSPKSGETSPEYEYLIVSGYNKKNQSFHVIAGDNESKIISFQKLFKSWNFNRSTRYSGRKRYDGVGGSMIFLQSQTQYSNNQNQERTQSSQTTVVLQADSAQEPARPFKIPPGNMTPLSKQDVDRVFNHKLQFSGLFAMPKDGNFFQFGEMNFRPSGVWPITESVAENMPPIKNQLERGTCSVFAAVSLAEFVVGEELSEQCLASASSGTDPGTIDQRAAWIMANGIQRNRDCPYDGEEGGRNSIPPAAASVKKRWPHARLERFRGHGFESRLDYIRKKISSGVPVGIGVFPIGKWWKEPKNTSSAVHPGKTEEDEWKAGNCVTESDGSLLCSAHALVVTGYNDATGRLEIRNSWGKGWKSLGYAEMTYDFYYHHSTDNPLVSLTPLPGTSDETFIEDSYQQLFNRTAEPGGFNYWIHKLRNEGLSRGHILAELYEKDETFLNQAYLTYLGNPFTDHNGWAPEVLAKSGRDRVISDLCGTGEHTNFCKPNFPPDQRCHEEFINKCYQQILNREAEPEHRSSWSRHVVVPLGRFEARKRIAAAPESLVQKLYLRFMGRWASRGEAKYWMDELKSRGFDGVRNAIKNSDEAKKLNKPLEYWNRSEMGILSDLFRLDSLP